MTALLTPDEAARLHVGVNVIVRAGVLRIRHAPGEPTHFAPSWWVALTGPCPTCEGTGHYVDDRGEVYEDTCPEDDCRDGRRIVPLYTECPGCNGHGFIGDISSVSGMVVPLTGCASQTCDGRVLVGRAAVVSIEPEDDGRNFRITLDVVELAA